MSEYRRKQNAILAHARGVAQRLDIETAMRCRQDAAGELAAKRVVAKKPRLPSEAMSPQPPINAAASARKLRDGADPFLQAYARRMWGT